MPIGLRTARERGAPRIPRRPWLGRPLPVPLSFLALALCVLTPRAAAAQATTREYQIKAAFLFNFGQFVTWSATELPPAGEPFVICVLGDDPFGSTLDAIVEGATIQDRPARIARHESVESVDGCQVLYVSASEEPRLGGILEALAGRSILTVGETEGFAERSGMIGFVLADNRLRLAINVAAATDAGLTISSRLLNLANVVRTGEE